MYEELNEGRYIEADETEEAANMAWDRFPVISDRRGTVEDDVEDYYFIQSGHTDKATATISNIWTAAANLVNLRRDYRYLYVVHTLPMAAYAQKWKDEIPIIAEVISPQQCGAELQKPGQVSMFDFCERYMDRLDGNGKGTG
jgi:chromo domain-containing protein 1